MWYNQKGRCFYSNIELILPKHGTRKVDHIHRASLDRIDSSKGYTKDNTRFVSTSINFMKNSLSHDDTIKLCKLIAKNYSDYSED